MGSSKEKMKHCSICAFSCTDSAELDVHNTSRRHNYNDVVKKFLAVRTSKAKDRHGVKVQASCSSHEVTNTPSSDSVKISTNCDVEEVTFNFTVKNANKPAELQRALLLHPLHCFSMVYAPDGKNPQIGDGESRQIKVTFRTPGVGIYTVPVCFQLKKGGREFQIIKELVVEVTSQQITSQVEEEEDSPFTSEPWFAMKRTLPATNENGDPVKKITDYPIPRQYEPLFKHNLYVWKDNPPMTEEQMELLYKLLYTVPQHCGYDKGFKDVYCTFFHLVLYLDEYFTVKGLHHYHMANVPLLIVAENRVGLKVPGLAEKRPSVIKGDIVSVRVHVGPDSWETIEYEGIIAEVRDSDVWIKGFNPRLLQRLQDDGGQLRFDVRFLFNRYPMYLMHRAIDWAEEEFMNTILFPRDVKLLPSLIPVSSFRFFNEHVYNNAEQRKAVINIVRGEARPAPYIVFGPPGTGKTNTIVEAILQVKALFKKSFILVCAASNAACDNITQKLIPHCTTAELLRLHSPSRDMETIPKDVAKYSNCLTVTKFNPQDKKKFRVTVCTLINAGSKLAIKKDDMYYTIYHYTHVFIDEAGQALEPEILVALGGILGPAGPRNIGGQLILAGDPKQLGPVCTSQMAEEFGLGVSLLERLMTYCPLYRRDDKGDYNPLYITKLLRNFRSHPSLLYLPNKLFYDEELQASCSAQIRNDNIGSLHLFGKRSDQTHTCIFHGVIGQELREGKSPSFYNQQEVDAVMQHVNILLNSCTAAEVKQSDIGIISPYIRQVYKLKYCLQSKGWTDVEVGTTETFQGREKRIIVISTVRSNRNLLDYDKRFRLGFLDNKKRFNVAITRARSLLIIVGCPHVLEMDGAWAELIAYSKAANSYKGCNYNLHAEPWMKEVMNRIPPPLLSEEC